MENIIVHLSANNPSLRNMEKTYCGLCISKYRHNIIDVKDVGVFPIEYREPPYEICKDCDMDFHGDEMQDGVKSKIIKIDKAEF